MREKQLVRFRVCSDNVSTSAGVNLQEGVYDGYVQYPESDGEMVAVRAWIPIAKALLVRQGGGEHLPPDVAAIDVDVLSHLHAGDVQLA